MIKIADFCNITAYILVDFSLMPATSKFMADEILKTETAAFSKSCYLQTTPPGILNQKIVSLTVAALNE